MTCPLLPVHAMHLPCHGGLCVLLCRLEPTVDYRPAHALKSRFVCIARFACLCFVFRVIVKAVRRTATNGAGGGSLLTMPGLTAFNATHEAERRQQLEVTMRALCTSARCDLPCDVVYCCLMLHFRCVYISFNNFVQEVFG